MHQLYCTCVTFNNRSHNHDDWDRSTQCTCLANCIHFCNPFAFHITFSWTLRRESTQCACNVLNHNSLNNLTNLTLLATNLSDPMFYQHLKPILIWNRVNFGSCVIDMEHADLNTCLSSTCHVTNTCKKQEPTAHLKMFQDSKSQTSFWSSKIVIKPKTSNDGITLTPIYSSIHVTHSCKLLDCFDGVPVCSGNKVPVNEVQGTIILRLQMVYVMSLWVGCSW